MAAMSDNNTVILSIDIGSTRTHIAAVDIAELSCAGRIDFDNADFDNQFIPAVKKILSTNPRIGKANISSCVKALAGNAKIYLVRDNLFDDIALVKTDNNQSIQFNYDNPEKLGTDRVCNALACAAMFKNRNCVIIDSGTAITIDYLHAGKTFEGGAILPGCTTQVNALHSQTDALPRVNLYHSGIDPSVDRYEINNNVVVNDDLPITLPSKSTENCIKSGVLYGIAGAVERCIAEYYKIISNNNGNDCGNDVGGNNDLIIAATGGGWNLISPLVSYNITTIPNLTLIGAALYR
jgi:type III pantothenate kinase